METLAKSESPVPVPVPAFAPAPELMDPWAVFTGPARWRERFEGARQPSVEPTAAEVALPDAVEDERARVADELRARGLDKKGRRYEDCRRLGNPQQCERNPGEHRYFERFRCGLRFCRECAPFERARLKKKYLPVVLKVIGDSAGTLSEFVLARVTFTVRSTGEVPSPEQVKSMNQAVKGTLRRVLGKKKFGLLFRDEFGYEVRGHTVERVAGGLNIHLHGLYFGPFLPWEKMRDTWMEETARVFGQPSRGFYISMTPGWRANPEEAARHALNHMLKYLSKPPAVSAERIADLEAAVHRVREVHALGLFYGVKVPEEKHGGRLCPACKAEGVEAYLASEVRDMPRGVMPVYRSVPELEAAGYLELPSEVGDWESELPGPEPSWVGESPPCER